MNIKALAICAVSIIVLTQASPLFGESCPERDESCRAKPAHSAAGENLAPLSTLPYYADNSAIKPESPIIQSNDIPAGKDKKDEPPKEAAKSSVSGATSPESILQDDRRENSKTLDGVRQKSGSSSERTQAEKQNKTSSQMFPRSQASPLETRTRS